MYNSYNERESAHLVASQGALQLGQRLGPRVREGDQLGDHRVVERAHRVARDDARVHAHAGLLVVSVLQRRAQVGQAAAGRQEVVLGVLRVDAGLHSTATGVRDDVLLLQAEGLARGDAQLQLDQVQAGDHLGHGVLHLQAGVHLAEVEVLGDGVDQKLYSAGTHIPENFDIS
jgi:hypothetical protein